MSNSKKRMKTNQEAEVQAHYVRRFGVADSKAPCAVERAVLGSSMGANGYTTVAQAELLLAKLPLTKNSSLLDLGSGCGWPGLYLAKHSGCRVVLTDLPLEGLLKAKGRAASDGLRGTGAANCTARALPFRRHTFDRSVHTDVLC